VGLPCVDVLEGNQRGRPVAALEPGLNPATHWGMCNTQRRECADLEEMSVRVLCLPWHEGMGALILLERMRCGRTSGEALL